MNDVLDVCVEFLKRPALAAAAALLVASCGHVPMSDSLSFVVPPKDAAQSPVETGPAQPLVTAAQFDQEDNADTGELRFQPGDAIKVSIWGYPELDHVAVVQPNGKITLPLVGEINAAESTAAELRGRIREGLAPYSRIATPELRTGDILNFIVWHDDSLRQAAVIDPSGNVTFPMVGSIRAVGRSVEEIRAEAEKRLSEYVRDAKVSIVPVYQNRRTLQDYAVSVLSQTVQPRRVAILGEVGLSGPADLKAGTRVIDLLAQNQVKTSTAAINSVVVIRNPPGGKPRYRLVRLEDYLEGRAPNENILLRGGDIVIVPKTRIAKVDEFVDLFLTRTMPVFQWYGAFWENAVAKQKADTVRLINESLERNLNSITITPP